MILYAVPISPVFTDRLANARPDGNKNRRTRLAGSFLSYGHFYLAPFSQPQIGIQSEKYPDNCNTIFRAAVPTCKSVRITCAQFHIQLDKLDAQKKLFQCLNMCVGVSHLSHASGNNGEVGYVALSPLVWVTKLGVSRERERETERVESCGHGADVQRVHLYSVHHSLP